MRSPDQTAGMKEKKIKMNGLNPSENTLVCGTVVAMWHKVCDGSKYLSPRLISTDLKSRNIFKKNLPQGLK